MKQFSTIFNFELKNYLKNKVFVGVTLFMVIILAVVMFFPRITAAFDSADKSNQADTSDVSEASDTDNEAEQHNPLMLICADNADAICTAFSSAFPDYEVKATEENVDSIKEKINSGEAECAFVFESLTEYTYYAGSISLYDETTAVVDSLLKNLYTMNEMMKSGMTAEQAQKALSAEITHETVSLGKDQFQNFFYTYIMIFALYMVILLYGQMVATNVATEKSSRAMELLITSAKPVSMMFGKVIASCAAGFIQLVCIFGSAFLFFNLNKSYWDDNQIINSIFNLPLSLLLYMMLFFVLGFFVYAFMYGAVGSTASKLEDINTSVMPITMLFIVGFFVVVFSMSSGNIDNTVMKICSYIPFTSPMAMFTRIAMSSVPAYEIIISVVILIASVFGIGVISAKIYRVGVLLYGTTPKISEIIKSIVKA